MSYTHTFSIALGSSDTGLTLKARLVDSVGSNVGSEITTGFVEIGAGNYLLTASLPDGHRGGIKIMKSDNTVMGFGAINPEELENPDVKTSTRLADADYVEPDNDSIAEIKAKTDTLGAARVTSVSPVSVNGDMQIIRGDDYAAGDGANRVFEWSDEDDVWPDLDTAAITFRCNSVEAEAEFIAGTPNKVRLELSQTDTAALPTGRPRFSIFATLANDHVVTLIVGSIRFVATEGLS